MDAEEFREWCLSFPGAVETFPFGEEASVFKVIPHVVGKHDAGASPGKMFALARLESRPFSVNLKCEPHLAIQLRGQYPQVVPGWHMSKKHWNTVTLEGLEDAFVRELVEDSYDLVVSGMTREQRVSLKWQGLAAG